MTHKAEIELLNKLADDADYEATLKLEQKDTNGAEYYRGLAAGFRCASKLIED